MVGAPTFGQRLRGQQFTLLHLLLLLGIVPIPTVAVQAAVNAQIGRLGCILAAILGLVVGVFNGLAIWKLGEVLSCRSRDWSERTQEWSGRGYAAAIFLWIVGTWLLAAWIMPRII